MARIDTGIAVHKFGAPPVAENAGEFVGNAMKATLMSAKLSVITA